MFLAIDEVGYGAWAGPVVICGLLFDKHVTKFNDHNILDSKIISKKNRPELFKQILDVYDCEIIQVTVAQINAIGLRNSVNQAIVTLISKAQISFDIEHIFLDGNINPCPTLNNISCIIKGDMKMLEIGMASIIAKVTRDKHMQTLHAQHPLYGWNTNVGYGTRYHRQQMRIKGKTAHHRDYKFSYL